MDIAGNTVYGIPNRPKPSGDPRDPGPTINSIVYGGSYGGASQRYKYKNNTNSNSNFNIFIFILTTFIFYH
jgi:hypothetical protein